MVTLNLTLVVELVLFLLFLWGTHIFILRPTVKNLDERDESVEQDLLQAKKDEHAAEKLEQTYQEEFTRIRREADEAIHAAHRQSNREHVEFLGAERLKADEAVASVRLKVQAEADAIRPELQQALPDIRTLMAKRVLNGRAEGGEG